MNNKERLKLHQQVFHSLHLARGIVLDPFKTMQILDLIDAWSFASNATNGQATDAEVKRRQDEILKKAAEL